MSEVIQIYKSVYAIDKSDYNFESRSSINNWLNTIQSRTGYVKSKTLFLADSERSNPDLKNADLIIIQDIEGFDPFIMKNELRNLGLPNWFKENRTSYLQSQNQQLKCFSTTHSRWDFELFRISKSAMGNYEFSLNYSANQGKIGLPKRNDHKIINLKSDKPFTYRINGKIDHYSQRLFMEFKYAIEYLGKINSIEFLAPNKIEIQKTLAKNNIKHIDERKILK